MLVHISCSSVSLTTTFIEIVIMRRNGQLLNNRSFHQLWLLNVVEDVCMSTNINTTIAD